MEAKSSKLLRIASVMARLQMHLIENIGNPINLSTISAFFEMNTKIIEIVTEES